LTDRNYRPDIDGLRAIAVVAVVLFHAFPARLPGGFIGVDIFFVISGYLISRIIFDELAADKFSFIGFYIRRARRLFPALIVVLLACILAGWVTLLADEYAHLGKHIAASVGFVQNLVLLSESGYFDNAAELKPLLHLWSLGIEEQFYIVWPVVLYLLWKRGVDVKWIIAIGALASFILCVWLTQIRPTTAFFLPVTRFWELLFGAGLAWMTRDRTTRSYSASPRLADWLSLCGLLVIAAGLLLITKQRDFPGTWALLPVTGAILLIYAGPDALINRTILSNRIFVWIGLISYPLYLWHWPLLVFAHILENHWPSGITRLVLVILSVGLAWITYAFVEQPIRRGNKRNVIALWLILFSLGGLGAWIYISGGVVSRDVVVSSQPTAPLIRIDPLPAQSCDDIAPSSKTEATQVLLHCKYYSRNKPQKTILFWGDSSVVSWLPVFSTIANESNYALVVLSFPSCPPIFDARKTVFTFDESKKYCADGKIQRQVSSFIRDLNPDLIVIAASWSSYLNSEYVTSNIGVMADRVSSLQIFERSLPETIRHLSQWAPLIVIKDWPRMPVRPNFRSIAFLGYTQQPISILRPDFDESAVGVNKIFETTIDPKVRYFDPAGKVCDAERCYSAKDGLLYYEDAYHMSPQGAMQFKEEVEALLANN
jgi:peptidoglycan/LPS O-acetylase OafA/YrhL